MRTPEQLLKAYDAATKERPVIIAQDEYENFIKAMKLSQIVESARVGKLSVSNITIMDADKLLKDGVLSPLDMKTAFTNRRDYADHLKRNGCVEIGNDFNNSANKKREIKGDFDCRNDLAQATHQIAEKYGH